jgi:hypothetical protein
MSDMDVRSEVEGFLGLGRGKEPSKDEPTDLILSDEEWVTRLIRNQGADSQITAIRAELTELGEAEDDIREWLLKHHNDWWYRGNGEWESLDQNMQQRLYWIGIEQRNARARVAALEAQVIAMAVFEDTQKMMDQAQAAAEDLGRTFIGPRRGYPRAPPVPFYPPRCHWDGLRDHNGRQMTYGEYLLDYRERKAEDLIRRRRVQDDREEELHQDVMINLDRGLGEGATEEYLGEIERHNDEVEEIEERRGGGRRLGRGNNAILPNGAAQGPREVVRTTRDIVGDLRRAATTREASIVAELRRAAAVREALVEDDGDDQEDEQEPDDDTR